MTIFFPTFMVTWHTAITTSEISICLSYTPVVANEGPVGPVNFVFIIPFSFVDVVVFPVVFTRASVFIGPQHLKETGK
jgi:hypothetical protein